MIRKILILTLSSAISAALSYGAWEKVDDFESYADQSALDAVWTQDNDVDGSGGGGVLLDDSGNKVLQFNMGATTADSGTYNVRFYRAIPNFEPASGKKTFYFRFAIPTVMDGSTEVPGVVDLVWGLSPVDDPTAYGDYSPLGRQQFNQAFDIYDTTTYVEVTDNLPGATWYEIWWIVDTDTRTVDVHIKGGDAYPTQTLVADDYGWRNQTVEALDRFLLTSSAGTLVDPKGLDSMLIDDIYMSAGENLSDPMGGVEPLPPGDAEFLNISTRGKVGTGADKMIGGFVVKGVSGVTTGTVLVRAIGPTLADFGLTGVLPDPVITVFNQSDPNTSIGGNDDWGTQANAAEIKAAMALVGAFPLADDSLDAVIMMALPPGAYTAQVDGKDGAEGVAIIEVYAVD